MSTATSGASASEVVLKVLRMLSLPIRGVNGEGREQKAESRFSICHLTLGARGAREA